MNSPAAPPSVQPDPTSLLARAAAVVTEHRIASVSLVQRHLQVGYGQALLLLAQLASAGVVEAPNPNGRYRINFAQLGGRLGVEATPPQRHARMLRELALYLAECRQQGDTRCITLFLLPIRCSPGALKKFAEEVLSGAPADLVVTLARALAALPQLQYAGPDSAEVLEHLEVLCAQLPSLQRIAPAAESPLHASTVRAMRYLEKRLYDGGAPHTRALDVFVHRSLLPQGRGAGPLGDYGEHVLACKLLCDEATRMIYWGVPLEEVAMWIEPYLCMVWIEGA